MFGLFVENILKDFWSNSLGDNFIDATINYLKVDRSLVDLNFYFIIGVPSFYEFDQDKKLVIKKEVISYEEQVSTDAEGNEVINQVEVKSYEVDKVIDPIVYMAKGIMVNPC
jgi:hypothetical protein